MLDQIISQLSVSGAGSNSIYLIGIGLGCAIGLFGLYSAFSGPEQYVRRFRGGTLAPDDAPRGSVVKTEGAAPSAVMKALVPTERAEVTTVQRQLAHAGFAGKDAVLNFYLIRALLGIGLPAMLLGLVYLDGQIALPAALGWTTDLSQMETFQLLGILVAVGFYGPMYWLRAKASARRQAISDSFPYALDLLQIAAEAGMAFDASVSKVAAEMEKVCPPIAEEFTIAQHEILAGRDRDKALLDMAARMGIDEASSFVNVVLQSKRFGTNISDALLTYSAEMRQRRELKAQEKANRLPVQMSAVMATLMLPALFLISLSPVVIRYMRYFAEH
jgi:tight adherence protein C